MFCTNGFFLCYFVHYSVFSDKQGIVEKFTPQHAGQEADKGGLPFYLTPFYSVLVLIHGGSSSVQLILTNTERSVTPVSEGTLNSIRWTMKIGHRKLCLFKFLFYIKGTLLSVMHSGIVTFFNVSEVLV